MTKSNYHVKKPSAIVNVTFECQKTNEVYSELAYTWRSKVPRLDGVYTSQRLLTTYKEC